ncbi:MAG: ectonucleotide pyrophosphatase/phosphodiesterase [Chitinophagaceae bacterium]
MPHVSDIIAVTKICLYACIISLGIIFLPVVADAQDTAQKIIPGRFNSAAQQQKPYIILISADGFRYDFAGKYNAVNLLRLRDSGVTASYMQPSFPSLTFPNHYSIVTGLYPAHHGLLDNTFYDGQRKSFYGMGNKAAVADSSWYGGTPLWVLAEQQQLLSASFYWVASESAIRGTRPTYYYTYNEKIGIDERINTVKNWLQLPEDKRPHLITFYFPEVDHAAHVYGPDSKQAAEAVHFVDESVGKMVEAVNTLNLPVNFIFLADHGMTNVDSKETLPLPSAVDTSKFYIPYGDALVHLYAKNKEDVRPTYKAIKKQAVDFDVYLINKTPRRWHYRKKDDLYNRAGDMILVPKLPKVFSISRRPVTPGKHGFDPALPDMRASFYAWGPAFKQHLIIGGFENVHVYPLIATILGLPYTHTIDGKLSVLKPTLK